MEELLLYHLYNGCQRPGELERLIPGARRPVLMQQLKELETDGLVRKETCAQVPRANQGLPVFDSNCREVRG